jgi:hypothetical protein
MARRWWKSGHLKPGEQVIEPGSTLVHDRHWLIKMIINGFGAFCTLVVMIVFAVTKFRDGAWVVIVLTPLLVLIFFSIHHHYKRVARQLSLEAHKHPRTIARNRVIMPIGGVHNGTIKALKFAQTLSDDVTAIHISLDPKEANRIEQKWSLWGESNRLIILHSPYRTLIEPLIEYIDQISRVSLPNEIITIVVPQFNPKNWWSKYLHTRTAETLRKALLNRDDIVIIEVPYQV